MPITPPVQPPAQPPIEQPVNVDQNQDQFQDQFQNQDNRIGELQQAQSTESDADSSADSSSINSANLSAIQVNNNSNRVEWDGIRIPETTINLSGYGNRNDFGFIGTVSVPIGGRSRKLIQRGLEHRVAQYELENERTYLSACASINDQGYVVVKDAEYASRLSKCGQNIVARKTAPISIPHPQVQQPRPQISNEIAELRAENAELKARLDLLLARLEQQPINGGY